MQTIIGAALRQRVLVLILAVLMICGGLFAYKRLNIEAYPDPVPPLVDIVTQNPGQSSEEIERYITVPMEVPQGVDFAAREMYKNISLRVIRAYDVFNDVFPCRLDLLSGSACFYPELGTRLTN